MQVICLQDDAFFSLIEQVVERLQDSQASRTNRWLSSEDAMEMLQIKSKSTIQKLRDEGKIRFSQPQKKIILYDRNSIEEYLNKHSRNTF